MNFIINKLIKCRRYINNKFNNTNSSRPLKQSWQKPVHGLIINNTNPARPLKQSWEKPVHGLLAQMLEVCGDGVLFLLVAGLPKQLIQPKRVAPGTGDGYYYMPRVDIINLYFFSFPRNN
jgi:hypothetical protein